MIGNLKLKDVPPQKLTEACLNTLQNLKSDKPKLLILDNADKRLAGYYYKLPKGNGWHVLVTSRERIPSFHIIELGFLTKKEAVKLFKKYYQK
ncbi:MAG: hypothetical protein V1905_01355, partial [bacterium]